MAPVADNKKEYPNDPPTVRRGEDGRLLPGSILNPTGMKPGTKHFATEVKEAFKTKNIEKMLLKVGVEAAAQGNFPFWQYIVNRLFPEDADKKGGTAINITIGLKPTPEAIAAAEKILLEEQNGESPEGRI